MIKQIPGIFGCILFGMVFVGSVHAQELTVTCTTPGTCTADTLDPLFSPSILWFPGHSESRSIEVQNQSGLEQEISTRADNSSQTGDLDAVLLVTITRASSGLIVYSGSLRDFYTQTDIPLGVLADGAIEEYTIEVTLGDVGNEYQGAQTQFDLLLDFFADDPLTDAGLLQVSKFNNVGSGNRAPGDSVVYTLQMQVGSSALQNVTITDLPPDGIRYQRGSWTARSNIRGNLKGPIPEPAYASPGTWNIGSVLANEVITLQYRAEIIDSLEPGTYRDLAWSAGQTVSGQPVIANRTINNPDPFVGTEVTVRKLADTRSVQVVERVEETTTTSSGDVLGAQSTAQKTLPKTGASIGMIVAGCIFFGTGLLFLRKSIMRSSLIILFLFSLVPSVSAADLSIRVAKPQTPTNIAPFPLTFAVLDLQNRSVSVSCLVKRPGTGAFTVFQTLELRVGGDSRNCDVTGSVLSTTGEYQFQVAATAGSETDVSEIITVNYSNVADPGTPTAYRKEKSGGCQYKISFKTADDSGKTSRIEVYRSSSRSFRADSGTRVESSAAGSSQDFTFFNSPPDCDRSYYYAVRAFNSFGDGSGVVGDREIVVTTVSTTTTSGTEGAAGAQTGTDGIGAVPVTDTGAEGDSPGEVEGEDVFVASDEQVLGVLTGTPESVPVPNTRTIFFGGIALGIGILLLGYAFFLRKRKKHRS